MVLLKAHVSGDGAIEGRLGGCLPGELTRAPGPGWRVAGGQLRPQHSFSSLGFLSSAGMSPDAWQLRALMEFKGKRVCGHLGRARDTDRLVGAPGWEPPLLGPSWQPRLRKTPPRPLLIASKCYVLT